MSYSSSIRALPSVRTRPPAGERRCKSQGTISLLRVHKNKADSTRLVKEKSMTFSSGHLCLSSLIPLQRTHHGTLGRPHSSGAWKAPCWHAFPGALGQPTRTEWSAVAKQSWLLHHAPARVNILFPGRPSPQSSWVWTPALTDDKKQVLQALERLLLCIVELLQGVLDVGLFVLPEHCAARDR